MLKRTPRKNAPERIPAAMRPGLGVGIVVCAVVAATLGAAALLTGPIASLRTPENGAGVDAALAEMYVVAAVSSIAFATLLYVQARGDAAMRKRGEADRENFRTALETAAMAVWIGRGGRIVFMNDAGVRMFGASSPGAFIGKPVLSLYEQRDLTAVESRIAAAQRGERGTLSAERLLRTDGSVFEAEVVRSRIAFAGDTAVISFARDVTERARAMELQRRLAAIVESSDDAILGKRLDGVITEWNLAAERMYGYTAAEIVGKPVFLLAPPEKQDEIKDILARLARGERIERLETRRVKKDGTVFDISVTISPIRDKDGTVVGASAISHDITERKRNEAELERYRTHLEELVSRRTAQLEAVNKELEAFAYTASHDLQAPLRTIDGFLQMFFDDHRDIDEKGRGQLERVRAASARMTSLITELLEFSRLSKREIHGAPVDLSALAASVVDDLRRAEPSRDVTVTVAPGLTAHGDEQMLRIALVNLIGNAWKFTSKTPHAAIEVGATPRDGGTTFFVRDNGAGFDPAYANKLFVPFQRLHLQQDFPGTGIGLATVRRIINRHGGAVRAEGSPGKGATFSFTLP